MTNEEMEAKLLRAAEKLPGPTSTAPSHSPIHAPRRRLSRTAVLIAAVLLLTITVYAATAAIQIPDPSGYCQWQGFPCSPEKYGLDPEPSYGEYDLYIGNEWWIIPRGTSWLGALFNATYRVGGMSYSNDPDGERFEGWGSIDIDAGSTDHPYWRAYFSMDAQDVPDDLHDMTVHTYSGYTLYCGEFLWNESDDSTLYVKWVDYERGFIYSISFSGAAEDRALALDFTKQLIDANR